MKIFKSIYFLVALSLILSCSSDDDKSSPTSEEEQITQMIQQLRAATADFSNINAAIDAGWDTDLTGCVEHPTEGGMGHHYARPEFLDGRVNFLEPQVLLYVMKENGEMEFLGVEYIVPFNFVGPDQTPPNLFFHDFHANHEQGFWALHVWSEKDNPSGMFEDWNPDVSCDNWIDFLINEVRMETAAFTDINAAIAAGWDTDLTGCVEHPTEGGMGHHYARMEFMDGRVNHLEPQVLLYNQDDNHEWEFLGVEYIVPFNFHPADEAPPVLFNQHFHANHDQGFWALHVWTEKENPSGMFYDWNPNVNCN